MAIHKIGGQTTESGGLVSPHKNFQEVLHVVTIYPFTRETSVTLTPTNMSYLLDFWVNIPDFGSYVKEGISYDVKWVDTVTTIKIEEPSEVLHLRNFEYGGMFFNDETTVVYRRDSARYSILHNSFNISISMRCLSGSYTFNPINYFKSALQIIITNSNSAAVIGGMGGGQPGDPTGKFFFRDWAEYDVKGNIIQANQGGPFEFPNDSWRYEPK